jgi:hypothetical protein
MLTSRPAKGLAVAFIMLAIDDPRWGILERPRQELLSFEQRKSRDVLAVELEEVEGGPSWLATFSATKTNPASVGSGDCSGRDEGCSW